MEPPIRDMGVAQMNASSSHHSHDPIQAPPNKNNTMADAARQSGGNKSSSGVRTTSAEYQLKKYLLLLATLVATVTYAAGLNLPGGSWAEGQLAGDSILRETRYKRYIVFFYFNAMSFAASLLAGLLLLILNEEGDDWRGGAWLLSIVRSVMAADLVGLMGAYAVGSCHDKFTTASGATVLASGVYAYGAIAYVGPPWQDRRQRQEITAAAATTVTNKEKREEEKEREILLVLAIFAATIAYVAGLNPPGGFWRSSQGGHTAGDPVLQADHPRRYKAFFFLNTTAFVASLLAIFVIVRYHHELQENLRGRRLRVVAQLYGPIIAALLGLGGAYAAGSCRDSKHTAYVFLGVVFPVVACICLMELRLAGRIYGSLVNQIKLIPGWIYERLVKQLNKLMMKTSQIENLEKTREYIQLLAVLAATIAYQAGLDPPGGVWSAIGEGHNVGDPILLTTHPARYKVFFYSNSSAFVASLVIMVMLQNEKLVRGHAVRAAMILDLFGLMGAYAAGSCRDTSTSIYTVAMAGAVLVYVVIHIVFFTLDSKSTAARLEKKREVLLLLAILAATLTYQAGLTPPGGVWEEDDGKLGRRAGFPVLQDRSPRRYKAFFYCNGASFMASVALIVLLLNQNLYLPGIQCYALVVCMVAGLFGLMGAYAAGSSLHLRTSIFVLVLMALVFLILVGLSIEMVIRHYRPRGGGGGRGGKASDDDDHPPSSSEEAMKPMYLMLVGILGASLTYMAGLKPPGGMWREDDGNGHSAGNPVLYDINKRRYNVFFYSNSISFVASITIIGFLLCRMMRGGKMHLAPLHTAMLLDLLALLGAYAAGSDRQMRRSLKVLVILPIVMVVVGAFYFVSGKAASPTSQTDAAAAADTSNGGSATTTTQQDTIHPLQSSV